MQNIFTLSLVLVLCLYATPAYAMKKSQGKNTKNDYEEINFVEQMSQQDKIAIAKNLIEKNAMAAKTQLDETVRIIQTNNLLSDKWNEHLNNLLKDKRLTYLDKVCLIDTFLREGAAQQQSPR